MPIQFRYNAEQNLLIVQSIGPISLQDLSWYRAEVSKLPLKPGLRCLSDLSASKLGFSKEDLIGSSEHSDSPLAKLQDGKMIMCVCDEDDRGILEEYASHNCSECFQVEVCSSLHEGRSRLGID